MVELGCLLATFGLFGSTSSVCAIAGPAPPSVGEARARFLLRQKKWAMAARAANVAKPTPMPIPATSRVEVLEDFAGGEEASLFVGVEKGELKIVVVEVLAGLSRGEWYVLLRDE